MREITSQLQKELKNDTQFIVVDIFENDQMLKEFNQQNRKDHIHYNENEKAIFQKILNDVMHNHHYKNKAALIKEK